MTTEPSHQTLPGRAFRGAILIIQLMQAPSRIGFCWILAGWLAASAAGAQFGSFAGYPAGTGSTAVTTADFDADGFLDLATANVGGGGHDVSILLGDGTGAFAPPAAFVAGELPVHLAACELDNDGRPDLAVANFATGQVSVLINTTAGAGVPAFSLTLYAVGSRINWVACADFDASGFDDLVVTRPDDDRVEVLLNNGNGTFATGVTYATGDGPWAVAPGDFDRDGRPDLAVINNASNDVSILLNAGGGTFLPQTTFPVGDRPEEVVAADLDHDGVLDLAVANRVSADVSVLLNDGAASFTNRTDYGVGDATLSVHAADLDCDGLLDLAADNNGLGRVAVLFNDLGGPGNFNPFVAFTVAGDPRSVVAGSFNGKGPLDLATASQNTSTVSVLLNTVTTTYTSIWTGGTSDNFGGGPDPATPSVLLAGYVGTLTGAPLADFDDLTSNRFLAHTFKQFPACVIGAQLEVRARVLSSDAFNDDLFLGIHDITTSPATAQFAWGTFFEDRPESGFSWNTPGQTATFIFDLGNLTPNSLRTTTSVLDLMATGELNFFVEDDTTLDYAKLTVRSCCNCNDDTAGNAFFAGVDDQFAGSTEPASPSTEVVDYIVAVSGQQPLEFDQADINRWFGHTFTPLIGCAEGTRLELRAMAVGGQTTNDSICLQLLGPTAPVYGWCRNFRNLPGSGGTWNTGQTAVFSLDLDNLPGGGSILNLFAEGKLDVLAQDDTKIDYLSLTVHPGCSLLFTDGFESGNTSAWSM